MKIKGDSNVAKWLFRLKGLRLNSSKSETIDSERSRAVVSDPTILAGKDVKALSALIELSLRCL